MLTYHFPDSLNEPVYLYLYQCIKNDILNSALSAEEKLPSKRALAEHLNISVITVQNAYNQLLIEGYIYSIEKKGYYVSAIEKLTASDKATLIQEPKKHSYAIDLARNSMDMSMFPFDQYSKVVRKVLLEKNEALLERSIAQGTVQLRNAIAQHLNSFSGMNVSASQIVIGAGSEYLYNLIIQMLGKNQVYGLENPGHLSIEKVYSLNQVNYTFLSLDKKGVEVSQLSEKKVSVIHTSVAHHFPTGITMPISRRLELLKWAKKSGGIIIEDDYDSEFRLNGKPIKPLFTLDENESVIYMNTFTKTLAPSFRIAYMVLPQRLCELYQKRISFYANSVSVLDQLVLAKFIEENHFERHIHRMRNRYKEIRNELIEQLSNSSFKRKMKLKEESSGLHFLIEYTYPIEDEKVVELAHQCDFNISTLSMYYHEQVQTHTLIINYSGLSKKDISLVVNKIEQLFQMMEDMI